MANQFAQYVANLRQSLFDEQILDHDQFLELERYAADTPGRLEEICVALFGHVAKFTDFMALELQEPPYNSLSIDWLLTQFREKNSHFGAARVTHQIDCMRNNVKDGNFEAEDLRRKLTTLLFVDDGIDFRNVNRCKVAFEHIKRESEVLQLKLENYLKVKNQGPPTEIDDQPEYGDMDSDNE